MLQLLLKKRLFICLLTISVPLLLQAEERDQPNPDWPCVQAYVPVVSAAVVWAGPSIKGMDQVWEQDKEIGSLVHQFTAPDYVVEDAEKEIADFADRQKREEKDHKLTLLFAGVIDSLNAKRKKELDGITLYAQGQAARANRLSEELDEMIRLQDDPSSAAQERFALMQGEMEIKQRMFDERETFIQYLCTRPRVVEEKLGSLARAIAYYLD
ncbi:MAG: hypothetical protein ABW139_05960 [Candidatus Thiodiazotropha sp. DIVDIV]